MSRKRKNILLVLVLVIIVAAIIFIDSKKVNRPALNATDVQSIALTATSSQILDQTSSTIAATTTATSQNVQTNSSAGTVTKTTPAQNQARIAEEAQQYPSAVELVPGGGFINSQPFTLKSLIGKKVILVDFWTYSCINCLRTIPYLNAWYQKYENAGLVIVGVHTPEFDFEKDYNNVANAVKSLGIMYPVVQDNNYATWDAYQNLYWPHEYLINIDGYIVHDKIGEGDYDVTEKAIQQALIQRDQVLGINQTVPTGIVNPSNAISINQNNVESPETYFGSNRNEYLGNGIQEQAGSQTLVIPSSIQGDALYLGGTWNFVPEYAENTSSSAKIVFQYDAKNVYIVASSLNGVKAKVLLDGKPISSSVAGADVSADGTITIQANRLYKLVQGASYGTHTLELDVEGSGLDAYTFTFG